MRQPWQQQPPQQPMAVGQVMSDQSKATGSRGVRFGEWGKSDAPDLGQEVDGAVGKLTQLSVDLMNPMGRLSLQDPTASRVGYGGAPVPLATLETGIGSLQAPTAQQNQALSDSLARDMEMYAPVATAEQSAQISEILATVGQICERCSGSRPSGGEAGQLIPVGAYALGVMLANQGDTVDCVYVAPLGRHLQELSNQMHEELQRTQGITCVAPVWPDGHMNAPGLQFVFRGFGVKLLFTHRLVGLPGPTPHSLVQNAACLTSAQVCETLIKSVPSAAQFRLLLRFVRYWARQRGIYGSHVGFFGGTAWAVCCARVCQMHPYIEISQLVTCFFRIMTRWDWKYPVTLLRHESGSNVAENGLQDSNWSGNSQALQAQSDQLANPGPSTILPGKGQMVVLLPVGQGISARQYVSDTTMKMMLKEFRRGFKNVQQVELNRCRWIDIYPTSRFFQRCRHYLEFDFMASTPDVLARWMAWSEQHLLQLVPLFESASGQFVTLRPWPEFLEFKDAEWPCAKAMFVGLHLERPDEVAEGGRKSYDLREPVFKFLETNSAWPEAKVYLNKFELLIRHVRLSELEKWIDCRKNGLVVNSKDQKTTIAGSSGSIVTPGLVPPGQWGTSVVAGSVEDRMQCSL